MASKARVVLNLRGLNALMTSSPVTAVVAREARRMAQQAGPDFEYDVVPHRWTARAFVRPANAAGRKQQADNAVLERVMGSR